MITSLSRNLSVNALANHVVRWLKNGNYGQAIPKAFEFAINYGSHNHEAYALCASVLEKAGFEKASLDWWDKSAGHYPHNIGWLHNALNLGWKSALPDAQTYCANWQKLVSQVFATPPPPLLLAELEKRGIRITGSIGMQSGRLKGWLWLKKGEKPGFQLKPAVNGLQLMLKPMAVLGDKILYVLDQGIENLKEPLILELRDGQGQHLTGSPLAIYPALIPKNAKIKKTVTPVSILIPVYSDRVATMRCLGSVFASRKKNKTISQIVVVWDNGPDQKLAQDLKRLAAKGRIRLISTPQNLGFLAAVNHGLRSIPCGDVILLNSDTLVHGDWIDRFAAHVKANPDAATITALGSNAELMSFPSSVYRGTVTNLRETALLDNACRKLDSEDGLLQIPVGVGFCMLITRKAIESIGILDGLEVCKGYSEEVDYCLRAREAKLVNYGAYNIFVAHLAGKSFGPAKTALAAQNNAAVLRRFPECRRLYSRFEQKDTPVILRDKISRHVLPYLDLGHTVHIYSRSMKFLANWEDQQKDRKIFRYPALFISRNSAGFQAILRVRGKLDLADMHFSLPYERIEFTEILQKAGLSSAIVYQDRLHDLVSEFFNETSMEQGNPAENTLHFPEQLESGNYLLLPPTSIKEMHAFYALAKANPACMFYMPGYRQFWKDMPRQENLLPLPLAPDLTPFSFLAIAANADLHFWKPWLEDHGLEEIACYNVMSG